MMLRINFPSEQKSETIPLPHPIDERKPRWIKDPDAKDKSLNLLEANGTKYI